MDLSTSTLHAAHDLLADGQISAVELTQAILDRIIALDDDVKAYLTLLPE